MIRHHQNMYISLDYLSTQLRITKWMICLLYCSIYLLYTYNQTLNALNHPSPSKILVICSPNDNCNKQTFPRLCHFDLKTARKPYPLLSSYPNTGTSISLEPSVNNAI